MSADRRRKRTSPGARSRGKLAGAPPTVVGEWTILAHPLFLEQIANLVRATEQEQAKATFGGGATSPGPSEKLLGHILDLIFEKIPANPGSSAFRLGHTLGSDYAHWSRAKTGGGRFRLFFRYSSSNKLILLVWINDDTTLRSYGKRSDAYGVFSRMLAADNPPDNWEGLLKEAEDAKQSVDLFKLHGMHTAKKNVE